MSLSIIWEGRREGKKMDAKFHVYALFVTTLSVLEFYKLFYMQVRDVSIFVVLQVCTITERNCTDAMNFSIISRKRNDLLLLISNFSSLESLVRLKLRLLSIRVLINANNNT